MTAEIISVGTELLLGQITDTNAAYLARTLAGLGINVFRKSVVGDNADRLGDALRSALARADVVILGGGLGPTPDDLTRETVAAVLGVPLRTDPEAEARLRAWFQARGAPMPEGNVRQALSFEGGTVFQNHNGTAPGLAIRKDGRTLVLLPGPPHEMMAMVQESVVPYLRELLPKDSPALVSRIVKVSGIGESLAADRVADLLESANPTVAPYAKSGEVHLRVTASGPASQAAAMVDGMVQGVQDRLRDHVFGTDDDTLESVILEKLQKAGKTLAGAESCTGGQIADRLTAVPGCSGAFMGAVVAYSNESKIKVLEVDAETLARLGAVSRETAAEMARGARKAFSADLAYATTGIAGPNGGTPQKPVGLVYVAVATEEGIEVSENVFRGPRDSVKRFATQAALTMLLRAAARWDR